MRNKKSVQLSMYIDGVVLGGLEQYRKAIDVIKTYRMLCKNVDALAMVFDSVSATPVYSPGKSKTKKTRAVSKGPKLVTDRKLAKQMAALFSSNGESDNGGKAALYAYRKHWMRCVAGIVEAGGPYFASHVYDSARLQLHALRSTEMVDYGNASRSWLVQQSVIRPLTLQNLGIPILRSKDTKYCRLLRDDRGWIVRLQYGRKDDFLELLIHGDVIQDGKTYTARLDNQQKYILKNLLNNKQGWSWQTTTLNMKEKRKHGNKHRTPTFWLQIPYRRPPRGTTSLKSGKVCEVTFKRMLGTELPKKKHDTGTDDDKTFIIHANAGSWGKHIHVDGISSYMVNRLQRRRKLELVRDGRRRMPKTFVRPVQQSLAAMAETRDNRMRQQNHIWSTDVVMFAVRSRCSEIKVYDVPDTGLLLDNSIQWAWCQFMQFLKYKAEEKGIVVTVIESKAAEKLNAALLGVGD